MFQQSAMMALGMFVFMRQTVPYQETSREISWRHPTNSVVGQLPRTQFTGKESETLSINGVLMPEITGGNLSIKLLELMAERGSAYPLINGATFLIKGWFVIESISVTSSYFFGDGTPRQLNFTMNLKRTDDSGLNALINEKFDDLVGQANEQLSQYL